MRSSSGRRETVGLSGGKPARSIPVVYPDLEMLIASSILGSSSWFGAGSTSTYGTTFKLLGKISLKVKL